MFHVDITSEDCRMIASEEKQGMMLGFKVILLDQHSGMQHVIPFATFCQVEKMAKGMICCHENLSQEDYDELETILDGCPDECRPIP